MYSCAGCITFSKYFEQLCERGHDLPRDRRGVKLSLLHIYIVIISAPLPCVCVHISPRFTRPKLPSHCAPPHCRPYLCERSVVAVRARARSLCLPSPRPWSPNLFGPGCGGPRCCEMAAPATLTPHAAAGLGERCLTSGARPILRAVSVTCTTAPGRFHVTFRDGSGGSATAALLTRPAALVECGSLNAGDVVEVVESFIVDVTPPGGGDSFPCAPRAPCPSLSDPPVCLAEKE